MPFYDSLKFSDHSKVLLWYIDETTEQLYQNLKLTKRSHQRLEILKSNEHKNGFLAIRQLLLREKYQDCDLFYSKQGKPTLNDGKNISISHSHKFSVSSYNALHNR